MGLKEFAAAGADGGEVADTAEIEAEAVDGLHAEDGVFAEMIGVFYPADELGVESGEPADVTEFSEEELFSDGAEEAFDFAFGGTISNGCVEEDDAEAGADEAEFFGGVVGAVIDVDGFGDAAFVDGGLEAVEEVGGVVGLIEGTVGDDAGGSVDADQSCEKFSAVIRPMASDGNSQGRSSRSSSSKHP